jgi:hypothetical protein
MMRKLGEKQGVHSASAFKSRLWKNFICLLMHDVIDQQSWPCAFFLERL